MDAKAQTADARDGRGRRARPGDWVVVHAHALGERARDGLILEVLGTPGHERYRVRWDEEHETLHFPAQGTRIVSEPPANAGR